MELICDALEENLHLVLDFVEEELNNHECNMKTTMAILVAVEEIYVNIAHYAYENKVGQAKITIDFDDQDNTFITFEDSGMYFNPLAKDDPDINAKAEDRDIGGLGIYMVKKTMDECFYEYKDEKNIFTMKKKIK